MTLVSWQLVNAQQSTALEVLLVESGLGHALVEHVVGPVRGNCSAVCTHYLSACFILESLELVKHLRLGLHGAPGLLDEPLVV